MEEKERYVIRYDLDYNRCLIDTEKNQGVGDYIQIVKLLNQQDKLIKELEKEAKKWKNICIKFIDEANKNADNYFKLYQELHDLPNNIVKEIKNSIRSRIPFTALTISDEKFFKSNLGMRMSILGEILDTILKKYGGEDE